MMVRRVSLFPMIVAVLMLVTGPVYAEGDAAAGEKFFKRCKACHTVEEGKNKVGPSLYKIYGRTAGRIEGFKYSPSYKQAGDNGLVWSEETLADYLKDPKKYLRTYLDDPKAKSRMVLKIRKEADRQNVVAYLKSLNE